MGRDCNVGRLREINRPWTNQSYTNSSKQFPTDSCRLSRNKWKHQQQMQHRRDQGGIILNSTNMGDFLEIGEVLNSPFKNSSTLLQITVVIVFLHMM